MRIGLLAFSTDTGLGNQTYAFWKYMKPYKTLVVDISSLNGMPTHHERYKIPGISDDPRITNGIPSQEDIDWITDDIDVIFLCETPLNYDLFKAARAKGVRTVLQYNFEFLDYFDRPNLPKPTVFAAPSLWNIKKMEGRLYPKVFSLPVPVDTSILPLRNIREAITFIHIAGRSAIHDRNGTLEFIQACRTVNKIMPHKKFILYCQTLPDDLRKEAENSPVQIQENIQNYQDMYLEGDVLILPRRYGGLCLPCQEAIGCGIPVLMPNIDPNNRWLPKKWLFSANYSFQFKTRSYIEVYNSEPMDIANLMIEMANKPEVTRSMHLKALEMAETMSWDAMLPRYKAFLEEVCLLQP